MQHLRPRRGPNGTRTRSRSGRFPGVRMVEGTCDTRFRSVREAFVANFADHGDVGAACVVVIDGDLVVDLWGGRKHRPAHPGIATPWSRRVRPRRAWRPCACMCWSTAGTSTSTRRFGATGLSCEPTPWSSTVSHSAGIPIIDAALPANAIVDWELMAAAVAAQEPMWEPGTQHGYHGVTFGWLIGEAVRRVTGETIGQFLRRKITGPLGVRLLHRHTGIGAPSRCDAPRSR